MAIAAEELAAATYRSLAERAARDDLRSLLSDMAAQEEAHRRALERVREGDLTLFAKEAPPVEVLWAPSTAPNVDPLSSHATALLAAIDSERQAFQLYANLARATDDPGLKTLLNALAREEASHWHKRFGRLIYLLSDKFPFLINYFANPDLQETLQETRRYFQDRDGVATKIRQLVADRFLASWAPDSRLLVMAHSLGSVIAFETLWELSRRNDSEIQIDLNTVS